MIKQIDNALVALLVVVALLQILACAGLSTRMPTPDILVAQDTTPETAPIETEPPPTGAELTAAALAEAELAQLPRLASVWEESFFASDRTEGLGETAKGFALAKYCAETSADPMDALDVLVEQKLLRRETDLSWTLNVPAFTGETRQPSAYPYTEEGVRELLSALLNLAGRLDDDMPLEAGLLGADGRVELEQLSMQEDHCDAAFLLYGPRSVHYLSFRVCGGKYVTDVEFSLLNLRCATGDAETLDRMDQWGDRQAATLMTGLELLLTGKSRAAEGCIPFQYSLEGYEARITRTYITDGTEKGYVTTYHIYKAE